jgi:transaldolase
VRALAGTDRMTIPPPLLMQLAEDTRPLPRVLTPEGAAAECTDGDEPLREGDFRWALANDGAANDKLSAGLRAFAGVLRRWVWVGWGQAA